MSVVNGESTIRYVHKDYQGSITAISDANSQIIQRMAFDAFGKRRTAVSWNEMDVSQRLNFDHSVTTRGYTGHEMLDEVDIIHMNGRTYDAEIGRFMQADPMVQDPGNGQNLNRYSYVLNSPMSYTDPSGYFYYKNPVKPKTNYLQMAIGIVLITVTAGQGTPVFLQMFVGAMVGGMNTGSFQGVATGAFTAWMMNSIGGAELTNGERMAAHMFAGGASSVLQGGKFGHGFVSSVVTSLASPLVRATPTNPGKIIMAAIVGGTASRASGGKFANGAVTAAFQWAFGERERKRPTKSGQIGVNDSEITPEENLKAAQKIFKTLYTSGKLDKKGYDFIEEYGGLNQKAFGFKYVDEQRSDRVADQDIYDLTGAKVYRGGANTLENALDTVAHEIWHLQPRNIQQWTSGNEMLRMRAETMAGIKASAVVSIWKKGN